MFEEWVAPAEGHSFFNAVPWCHIVLAKADAFLVRSGFINGKSPLDAPDYGEQLIKGSWNE